MMVIIIFLIKMMMMRAEQVSVLERMDEGLKVLECLLPAYFKVLNPLSIIIISIIVIIIVIVFCLPSSR